MIATDAARHRIYLVDGSGYIFRAYYALPPLTRPDGTPVGAVLGFCNMLQKLIDDTKVDGSVSHLAVVFDSARKTFRNDIYPEYKANREAAPEDLVPQFSLIRDATRAFSVHSIEREGYEADDIIATFVARARTIGAEVVIVSSDKDLMQLVGDGVTMLDPMKNRIVDLPEVLEKFGVAPDRVVDVQSLAGDSTDNVPGVPGIGIKTAAQLINEYGDLESLLARAAEIKQPKRRENLIAFAEQARISRQLVALAADVPLEEGFDGLLVADPDPATLEGFLAENGFKALLAKVRSRNGSPAGALPAAAPPAGSDPDPVAGAAAPSGGDEAPAPSDSVYELVQDTGALRRWIAAASKAGVVAVDTETTSLDAMRAELVGVSLSAETGRACYIPLGHVAPAPTGELAFDGGDSSMPEAPKQIDRDEALALLKPMLEDPAILKVGQNLKYDLLVLRRYGVDIRPFDDTMLLSFTLDAGRHGHGMDELSELHLAHKPIAFKDVAGSGKAMKSFAEVPLERACDYAAEDADVTLRLFQVLKPRLATEHLATVYETIERPLAPVLVAMEAAGIKIDSGQLTALSSDFAGRIAEYEKEIHALAGDAFNVGSPKQLGEILFDRMGLEGGKKGRNGAWSTDANVLEKLAAEGHELPARVLDWRQLAKLKSTYTDALQNQINPQTGRVHTSFAMAAAATGRLASTDPNLQNIPVRTAEGRKLRRAFIAEPGHKLISADYSQIELRLLAHIADIGSLKAAFRDGLDIHAMTASQVFGVPIEGMDPSVRRSAKAINFGIIYGISAFGLAQQLGVPQRQARDYIDAYFEKYPGIRAYMDRTKEFCHHHGYVETVFGRRCHIGGINDRNPARRGFSERAAINAPIQGSAADIIKRAMIRMPEALAAAGLKARMLLQVHDELIFEAPEAEAEATAALVTSVMEKAALPARALSVPLTVDAGIGDNWGEAH
ncbi:DNA polymerase I [Oceanibacterium hippocampi]|uniref:DNA polymerase I n=1 Tax=Oceanibacterium hippocampi TaxID=745714 RepID=A0A1Y5RJI8_9PROT|nr:DNA polymerase I [Oceanibacterium hippocampi]SLN18768.1 DNA polymerase I [Oceanibacterium hippocampi]